MVVWEGQVEGVCFYGLFDPATFGLFEQGEAEIEADDFCLGESFLQEEADIA